MIGLNIDMDKTAEHARDFLSHDLPGLVSMADKDITSLSSPQLSWAPSHSSGGDSQQDLLINHWSAQTALEAIHAAAHHIPELDDERQIFILTYFKKKPEKYLTRKFAISPSTLRRRKNKALVEFAIRLDVQKVNKQHQCDWISSLVVTNHN